MILEKKSVLLCLLILLVGGIALVVRTPSSKTGKKVLCIDCPCGPSCSCNPCTCAKRPVTA